MKNNQRDLEREKAVFGEWRRNNPSAPFKDFYADRAKRTIAASVPHGSLGSNLLTEPFGEAGLDVFQKLVGYGLKPDDTCVDYGCGTLRIGVHVIRYLGPGRYWGMDIAEFFLAKGRELVGDELLAEKQPNLRVISAESVAEVAALKPDFLFSVKVLQHVHPDELTEYFTNIIRIVGTTGQAVIGSHWSKEDTVQYAARGWDHAIPALEKAVAAANGQMLLLNEEEDSRRPIRRKGEFFVVHKDAASDPNHRCHGIHEKQLENLRMNVVVTAERSGQSVAQTSFELDDKLDSRKAAKIARKAFAKFVKEHPNVSFFDGDVRIKLERVD